MSLLSVSQVELSLISLPSSLSEVSCSPVGQLFFSVGKFLPTSCRRCRLSTQPFSVVTAVPFSVVPAVPENATGLVPFAQDSSDDGICEGTKENLEKTGRLVIYTTKDSRTARVISNEPEYISDRYVKTSLVYQIELSNSSCLNSGAVRDVGESDTHKIEEPGLGLGATGGVPTLGSDGFWRSKTYLRHIGKGPPGSREVSLKFLTKDIPLVPYYTSKHESKREHIQESDNMEGGDDPQFDRRLYELVINKEERSLLRSWDDKRRLAAEIFEGALLSVQLSPPYVQKVMPLMTPFIDRIVTEAVALKKYPTNKDLSFNSRARLYISQTKVAELVKWLKDEKFTSHRLGKLISVADEYVHRIKSRVELLKTIRVTGKDLGLVLQRQPRILVLSLQNLSKTIEILETAGVKRASLGLVVTRSPEVLTLEGSELVEKISMFTSLGISKERFGDMVFKFPAILGHFSVEEMQSKVEFLQGIGIDDCTLVKILASTPQLLACNIEDLWLKLRFFYFLQIDSSGVRRILASHPSVFCLNLYDNISPKVKFLRAIGISEEEVGQVIVNFPAILTYSLDNKIRLVVRFLLEDAGIVPERVGKVISLQPELIKCSVEHKLQVSARYFRSMCTISQLGRMVEDFPALLMYNVAAIYPKFQYVTRVMKRPVAEVVVFPRYFSYSLKLKIIPRHELLLEKGLAFSLRYMLACSDSVFNSRVAEAYQMHIEHRRNRVDGVDPKMQFLYFPH